MIFDSILRGQPCLTISCSMILASSGLVFCMCVRLFRFIPVKSPSALLKIHVILLSSNGNVLGEVEVKVEAETAHAPVSIGDVNDKC
jgi:hypothetical protein